MDPAAADGDATPPVPGLAEGEYYRVTRHQVIKEYVMDNPAFRRALRGCLFAGHYSAAVVPMGGIPLGDIAQSMATLTSRLPEWARVPVSPGAGRLGATRVVTEEDIATLDPLPHTYRGATLSPPEPPPGEILEYLGTGQGWSQRAGTSSSASTPSGAPAAHRSRKRPPPKSRSTPSRTRRRVESVAQRKPRKPPGSPP